MESDTRTTEFVELGHTGSRHYAGLATFANPGGQKVRGGITTTATS